MHHKKDGEQNFCPLSVGTSTTRIKLLMELDNLAMLFNGLLVLLYYKIKSKYGPVNVPTANTLFGLTTNKII